MLTNNPFRPSVQCPVIKGFTEASAKAAVQLPYYVEMMRVEHQYTPEEVATALYGAGKEPFRKEVQTGPRESPLPVMTVGALRTALEGHHDEELVHAQVVAQDHTAWTMHARIAPVYGRASELVMVLDHPQLETLPTGFITSTKTVPDAIMKCLADPILNGALLLTAFYLLHPLDESGAG